MSEIIQNINGIDALCVNLMGWLPTYLSHYTCPYELMFYTGCRAGEAIDQSRWSYASNGDVRLQPLKRNYTRTFDRVQLPIDFDAWLNKEAQYIYPVTYRQLQHYTASQWAKFNIKVGESNKLLHVYRHRYVKELIENGFTIEQAKESMGHSHIENTISYATSVIKANVNFEQYFGAILG